MKIIFLTGGVCSSVGKGIAISTVAIYLKALGLNVKVKKCDPYLNIDPGTLSPFQHGEVFVMADGVETDLDIGHYERFTDQITGADDYITSGKIYWNILNKERAGGFNGKTVQVIPHVTDAIKESILADSDDLDYLLCEIGGTVGDLEASPYYEAIRQLQFTHETYLIHTAYMPYLPAAKEIKTKPVQHSLKELLSLGLRPNIIICRSDVAPDNEEWKEKIASYANLPAQRVILGESVENTYQMPCMYGKNGLFEQLVDVLKLPRGSAEAVEEYAALAKVACDAKRVVSVGVVGKYTSFHDSYKSLSEALFYSTTVSKSKLHLEWICAEKIDDNDKAEWKKMEAVDCMIIPGGFGNRGIEGMIKAAKFARENNKPLLGICLGMQIMVVEAARSLLKIPDATSAEWADSGTYVIDLISKLLPESVHQNAAKFTNNFRIGEYQPKVTGKLAEIYQADQINERFRHRYEFSADFIELLKEKDVKIVAYTPMCSAECFIDGLTIDAHPFYVGVQFHPEFKARPLTGHKLFNALIDAAIANKDAQNAE